ncbi:2-phospho-L-lactate transferase CofD family protein [Actinomadura madurae]|uniref:2-phospho-L-lactate transferase CofD family protein n=1 Tax=Actinomadura madurae TaxID=1993 RepID=UPI0020D23592|nr:2-phospho-L-lactate transferase CofD family protein [Actinomadura madurae]MCP9952621.1 2-phospho-L-lactate transferase CofD family protein [Actinomadura madurae]MCP9981846.1 2-phospho-L-lactate transferase CofD family protein [Actinomadura madurae]MCQ0018071.1 2-phospho-L-lactate transferase CofD family protein [Actinomadura madurae]
MSARVAMFSGGRGGAAIARELLRTPGIRLTLLINGYDNGMSTGALRRYLPGMLGPSDFRKNLLLHLDARDPGQAALAAVLEHRLPDGTTPRDLAEFVGALAVDLVEGCHALPRGPRLAIARDLAAFLDRLGTGARGFDLADCALGNLVFAGAYLRLGEDFNAAVRACAATFGSPVRLLNVTGGENAHLAALKEDGRLLADEAEIVAPQDPAPITDLFLLRDPVRDRDALEAMPAERVRRILAGRRAEVSPNPAALAAIRDARLIVYGPGTPHSSLYPSYLAPGVAQAVAASRAAAKVLVVNIREDHDVQGLTASDHLARALVHLGDPFNERRTVTHVLCHEGAGDRAVQVKAVQMKAVPVDVPEGTWGRARWISADLAEPARPGTHSGPRTVRVLTALAGLPAAAPLEEAG